ncbi:LysM peptidoglycan-binding domain-containing protein [Pedobacter cryophilus]|uniref:LysM peptidoglycan-binding domain-containing protein n=1 Tax=Pedobacter cryophilus TaxID=2571271 RepID=A0A4U1BXB5_9SPHI|nr:LysM peptidoglycan-binding domain-containing protein [Pedobacter cryophilus]TKB96083.1 LysM peptidoglycan-binding domain-containing protein [Pedobacter cryophilus]
MNYKTLLFLLVIFSSTQAFSRDGRDSTGIENLNGKKIILHKIEAKETYYSLGRRYNVSPQSIMEFNKNTALHPSETIKIPTQQNFNDKPVSFSSPNKTEKPAKQINHKVQPGETLYAIASKYNMRVDDIKLLNGLKTNSLSVGQTLKVTPNDEVSLTRTVETNNSGKAILVEKPKVKERVPEVPVSKIKYLDSTDSQPNIEIPKNRYGITEVNDKGLAVWIDDNNLDATKSYALHKTAPVGTIVKITNPMSNRSVFAKVVGRYTENETTKDVIIVITKATADAIGALDKRFLVNITFGIPNEQQ